MFATPPVKSVEERDKQKSPPKTQTLSSGVRCNVEKQLSPPKLQATSSSVRQSVEKLEAAGTEPQNLTPTTSKTEVQVFPRQVLATRLAVAKANVIKAKTNINNSRNIRTDIKSNVLEAVDKLHQLIKDADIEIKQLKRTGQTPTSESIVNSQTVPNRITQTETDNSPVIAQLKEQSRLLTENGKILNEILEVKEILKRNEKEKLPDRIERSKVELSNKIDAQMAEIKELKAMSKMQAEKAEALMENIGTYAQVAAMPPKPSARKNMHSIIVSSSHESDTADTVVEKIRATVDAKGTGLRIDHLRRAKNQSVIISCSEKEEIGKVSAKLKNSRGDLKVEEAVNKNPLVVVRDVMNYITDDDLVTAIRSQNGHLLEGAEINEGDIRVMYKRRARNPLTSHVVLRVKPVIWQRLTLAGRIHVDLQRVVVRDQSPLIQCTKCLGYGHSRKYCTEPAVLCSHCGEPHTRAECPGVTLNEKPKCRNCTQNKKEAAHNAFDTECPTRKKWDALARSAVAYC